MSQFWHTKGSINTAYVVSVYDCVPNNAHWLERVPMRTTHSVFRTRRWRSFWPTLKIYTRWLGVIRVMWVCLCIVFEWYWSVTECICEGWFVIAWDVWVHVCRYGCFDSFSSRIGGESLKWKPYPQVNILFLYAYTCVLVSVDVVVHSFKFHVLCTLVPGH